jgi:signal transduction histidine kinase/ActR/RegA family two-component response regulator
MKLSTLLDERFEAVGADSFRMARARAVFAVILALLLGLALSWMQALSWLAALLATEICLWVVTAPMGTPDSPPGARLAYFWATLISVPIWIAFGPMMWLGHRPVCQMTAAAFWAGQLLYAQNFSVKSPVSVALVGAPSALAPLLFPLLFPRFHGLDQVMVITMLGLYVMHALNGTLVNMHAAARLTAATRATLRAKEDAEKASRENVLRALQMETLARERLHATEQAEAANRAKSEFLANMSHEIRTPLNGVLGLAGALRRTTLDERQTEMVRVIEDSAESLQVLLADVLDMARVEAGRLEITPEPFELREVVVGIAELFRPKAEEKGLELVVRVDATPNLRLLGDRTRIKQILGNLLSNAVKFTAAGSITLRVNSVALSDGRRDVRFEVADSGIGFDESVRQRLFARFVQADGSITRRFGGTGLGLSISSVLADLMGGTISVASTPGVGSTFTLSLPLPVAQAAEVPEASPAPAPAPAPADRSDQEPPLRILAAEDHAVNRKVLQLIFDDLAVDMTMVENGAEAVRRFDAERFDLILMDMQMPVMDGLQAIAEIRSRERSAGLARTPIIMLTANALPEHEAAGRGAGADAFVTKPISAQHLLGAIEATLAKVAQAA